MKLSVGLPVWNGERFLEGALHSILEQSFGDFELIISDNASTDRTAEICHSFDDSRIVYHHQPENRGAAWNFNRVFELANGEFFKWTAHDDLLAPNYFERCIDALHADPEAVLSYTGVQSIDEEGQQLGSFGATTDVTVDSPHIRFREMILKQHPCHHVFGVFRSSALRRSPLIGPYMASDRVLLAQLALMGRFQYVPEILFFWRRHSKQSIRFIKTPRSYTHWFDPNSQAKLIFPNWRLVKEYASVVEKADLSLKDRLGCWTWVAVWPVRYAPWLGVDILRCARVAVDDPLC